MYQLKILPRPMFRSPNNCKKKEKAVDEILKNPEPGSIAEKALRDWQEKRDKKYVEDDDEQEVQFFRKKRRTPRGDNCPNCSRIMYRSTLFSQRCWACKVTFRADGKQVKKKKSRKLKNT